MTDNKKKTNRYKKAFIRKIPETYKNTFYRLYDKKCNLFFHYFEI